MGNTKQHDSVTIFGGISSWHKFVTEDQDTHKQLYNSQGFLQIDIDVDLNVQVQAKVDGVLKLTTYCRLFNPTLPVDGWNVLSTTI